jgi:hypothetical protein
VKLLSCSVGFVLVMSVCVHAAGLDDVATVVDRTSHRASS